MDNARWRNEGIQTLRGVIEEIVTDGGDTLLTVAYTECMSCNRQERTVILIAGRDTLIYNESGDLISVADLQNGMLINAVYSATMTRSIPPQATAYRIRIVKRPAEENITEGRIIDINRRNRIITTISNGNTSSIIQFHVPEDAVIRDIFGRETQLANLIPGLRVRVKHAAFITASLPPQTTAYEIQVIK